MVSFATKQGEGPPATLHPGQPAMPRTCPKEPPCCFNPEWLRGPHLAGRASTLDSLSGLQTLP